MGAEPGTQLKITSRHSVAQEGPLRLDPARNRRFEAASGKMECSMAQLRQSRRLNDAGVETQLSDHCDEAWTFNDLRDGPAEGLVAFCTGDQKWAR